MRVGTLPAGIPADAWHRLSCGDGAKGPRVYDWAVTRTNSPEPDEYARWVLIRRSASDPTEVAYFACGGPPATTLNELVRVAGARWAIEDLFEFTGAVAFTTYLASVARSVATIGVPPAPR